MWFCGLLEYVVLWFVRVCGFVVCFSMWFCGFWSEWLFRLSNFEKEDNEIINLMEEITNKMAD